MINRKNKLPYVIALALSVSGCELLGPELHEKLPLEPLKQINDTEQPEVIYQELSNESALASEQNQAKIELYPGSGEVVSHKNARRAKKATGKGEYSLNFDDADLGEVAKVILSDILAENYVLSPKVTGRVTLQTSQPLTKSELLPTLDMLLDINNAAMVYQDGLYQIKTKTDALSGSAFSTYKNFKNKVPAGYQVRVVPVRNVSAEELADIIKPVLQEKTILHVDSNRNMMLIAGTTEELARAMEMVSAFDVSILQGRSFGLFPLKNVEAAKIIEELEHVFNQKGEGKGGSFFQFMPIERLNAILAITHQARYLQDIERWVLRLDRANTTSGGGVNVYRVQHVDAVELATTLNEIFAQGGGNRKGSSSVASGRKKVEITNKNKRTSKVASTLKKLGAQSLADVGEVKIIADEVNNALIIVATAQDYAVVQRVIKQLDVMPLQVLIDATIVDVTLTDNLKYGIKWALTHNNGQNSASSNKGTDLFDAAKSVVIGSVTGGFSYAFVSNDVSAVLEAEASKSNVNVISSPSLMVLNNQEASIQVGTEVSLKTSESTNTSGGTNNVVTNTIQQRKTGVTLTIKPRVNASGLVIMDIEQKIEDFAKGSTNGNPNILSREIKSSVAVNSGETIVLGGLISENNGRTKDGIPFLYELPLIGALFGNTDNSKRRTELVVLITPRVVKSKQDARLVTNEFKRMLSGIYQEQVEIPQE
ncbi:MAG: type II secretion system secretin GspD [Methylococcaceae bacterium]|nr:type II secretion system secretin GspD [Methylococcaceae bacterium]